MLLLLTCSHQAGGGLGWVNAEANGVIAAIRRYTHYSTAHAFRSGVSGMLPSTMIMQPSFLLQFVPYCTPY